MGLLFFWIRNQKSSKKFQNLQHYRIGNTANLDFKKKNYRAIENCKIVGCDGGNHQKPFCQYNFIDNLKIISEFRGLR